MTMNATVQTASRKYICKYCDKDILADNNYVKLNIHTHEYRTVYIHVQCSTYIVDKIKHLLA